MNGGEWLALQLLSVLWGGVRRGLWSSLQAHGDRPDPDGDRAGDGMRGDAISDCDVRRQALDADHAGLGGHIGSAMLSTALG
jgi:hypothetical protein